MIKNDTYRQVKRIGDGAFELINFISLPCTASREHQIDALKKDSEWLTDYIDGVKREIDELIKTIKLTPLAGKE